MIFILIPKDSYIASAFFTVSNSAAMNTLVQNMGAFLSTDHREVVLLRGGQLQLQLFPNCSQKES